MAIAAERRKSSLTLGRKRWAGNAGPETLNRAKDFGISLSAVKRVQGSAATCPKAAG
ncbi:hypothetical protein [Paracoccus angustae]|uniref:hypothetical protein n=1 Tax=Paracoccus angustae TaxID=1671480 RepID=UPI0036734FF6